MTGMETVPATDAVSSQSKPIPVPSRSMDVSRISPAPRDSASLAQSTTFLPVDLRPPATNTSASAGDCCPRLPSIATTTACDPKRLAILEISSGPAMAGINADLVCACVKNPCGIVECADPPAHGEGYKELPCRSAHNLNQCLALSRSGRDIEQHNLVCAGRGVCACQFS